MRCRRRAAARRRAQLAAAAGGRQQALWPCRRCMMMTYHQHARHHHDEAASLQPRTATHTQTHCPCRTCHMSQNNSRSCEPSSSHSGPPPNIEPNSCLRAPKVAGFVEETLAAAAKCKAPPPLPSRPTNNKSANPTRARQQHIMPWWQHFFPLALLPERERCLCPDTLLC